MAENSMQAEVHGGVMIFTPFRPSQLEESVEILGTLTEEKKSKAVLDLSLIMSLSSQAVSSLRRIKQSLDNQGGDLRLSGTHLLGPQISTLESEFKIFPTAEAAARSFKQSFEPREGVATQ